MAVKNMDMETKILNTVRESIDKSIVECLTSYSGPLKKLCEKVISDNEDYLYQLIKNDFGKFVHSNGFKDILLSAIQKKTAKVLISNIGGEIEKKVNDLKKDPATRAKITVALSELIDSL